MTRQQELENAMYESAEESIGSKRLFQSNSDYLNSAAYEQAKKVLGREPRFFESVKDFVETGRRTAIDSGYTRGNEVLINHTYGT